MPHIVISHGQRFHKEWVFHNVDIVTVGRVPTNDIMLPDPQRKVSRSHAAIIRAAVGEERYFVRDLGSLLGTKVGGVAVQQKLLSDGDVIQIADYELIYGSVGPDPVGDEALDVIEVLPEPSEEEDDQSTVLFPHQGVLKELPLSPQRTEVVEELLKRLRWGCQVEVLFEDLIDPILHAVGATRGFLGLFDPERKLGYRAVGVRGLDLRLGERIRIADPAFLERIREAKALLERATILVPVISRREVIAFLCLQRSASAESFSEQDARFLLTLGRLTAAQVGRSARTEGQTDAANSDETFEWPVQIIGKSDRMREVLRRVSSAASTDVNVLLLGETGTGKGVIARAIHDESTRRGKPFVNVDLANLPSTLAESELFGYRRGAFSDAKTDRKGRFELAERGTIFLDEIGTLSLDLQAKLLKPIGEKEMMRLGDEGPLKVDVRIIAATNKDLALAVEQGTFARDLYRRINTFRIGLPPLRERRQDIPLLVFYFLDKYARLYGKNTRAISHHAMQLLLRRAWPGNVGELEAYIAAAVSEGKEVLFSWDFPAVLHPGAAASEAEGRRERAAPNPPRSMDEVEREHLIECLGFTRGNITRAAEILNWSRQTVLNKMDQYGIPRGPRKVPGGGEAGD